MADTVVGMKGQAIFSSEMITLVHALHQAALLA